MPRSSLIQLFTRVIQRQDRKDKIYCNGADNQYPERIERVINNSVTAKLAVLKTISFLKGFGFGEDWDKIIVNSKKKLTLYDILDRVCKDVAKHNGAYIHVNYDIEGVPNYLDVLPYKRCRISEEDDNGVSGFVWYSKDWTRDSIFQRKRTNKNWFYPYNSKVAVINEQRKNDNPNSELEDQIRGYRGQVYFLNLEPENIYPNSPIDAAYNDADTEFRVSEFRNDRVRNGFMGANIIMTPYQEDEKETLINDEELKQLLGSDNASNILRVEPMIDGDKKLSDYIHVETFKSEVDTEQFQYDEKKIQENILDCYQVPRILVRGSEGALFGANAEAIETEEKRFNRTTESTRRAIEDVFKEILFKKNFKESIIPLVEEDLPKEAKGQEEKVQPQKPQDGGIDDTEE